MAFDDLKNVTRLNNGQPSYLAFCLDNLDLREGDRVLHVGCGVGYYTVMAAFTGQTPTFPSCGSSSEPKGYITNWTVTNNTFELATAYIDDCPARRQGSFVWSGNTGG